MVPEGVKVEGGGWTRASLLSTGLPAAPFAADDFGDDLDVLVADELWRDDIAEAEAGIIEAFGAQEGLAHEVVVGGHPIVLVEEVPAAKAEVKASKFGGEVGDAKIVEEDVGLFDIEAAVDRAVGGSSVKEEGIGDVAAEGKDNDAVGTGIDGRARSSSTSRISKRLRAGLALLVESEPTKSPTTAKSGLKLAGMRRVWVAAERDSMSFIRSWVVWSMAS